jgi:hypothetical protein
MCTTCIYGSFGEVGILIICLIFYGCVFTMAFFGYQFLSGDRLRSVKTQRLKALRAGNALSELGR